ncbi:C4-dicarboxylate ABC transporter permease [Sporosarcina sp. P2]|uniref:TRAP transporter small permease n=1 Tax=Sporosarcina sp. P2 TaxID=2048251 RepID=UPI000C16AE61|nr:TRAP transporter small permease [Sporosarcina sp. P2]PID01767.1 C4-dicarboxylate ABC transporter permease [Sporosarcina sp. P2]
MRNEQIVEFDIESASFIEDKHEEKVVSTSNLFFKTTDYLNRFLAVIAGMALMLMMLLIVFNSIKRMYSDPIAGTVEIVSWLGAITGIFALGYTQLNKGHVYIDMLVDKFPSMLRRIIHTVMNVLSASFFLVAAWQLLLFGLNLGSNGVVSQTIQFSFYPIVILSSIGFIGLVLAIVKETILIWKVAS